MAKATEFIGFRVPPGLKRSLKAKAKRAGVSVGEYLRRRVGELSG